MSEKTIEYDDEDLSGGVVMTKWNCPGNIFYIGTSIVAVGILYSKSMPGHTLVFNLCSMCGFAFLAYWGHYVLQQLDVTLWFSIISTVNLVMFLYRLKGAMKALRNPSSEALRLYDTLFAPMNVPRKTFNELMQCSEGVLKIEANDLFAAEGQRNSGQELSVLLSGKLIASQNEQPLHVISPGQFMDSPEWEAFDPNNNRPFRVTIVAEVDSTYITWKRHNIEKVMRRDRYLDHMMNLIIGRDIAYKLYTSGVQGDGGQPSSIWAQNQPGGTQTGGSAGAGGVKQRGGSIGFATGAGGTVDETMEESYTTPNSSADSKHSEV